MFEFASYQFHKERIKIEKVTMCRVPYWRTKKEKNENLTGFYEKREFDGVL